MREKLKQEVIQTQETNGKEEACKRQLTLMNTNNNTEMRQRQEHKETLQENKLPLI